MSCYINNKALEQIIFQIFFKYLNITRQIMFRAMTKFYEIVKDTYLHIYVFYIFYFIMDRSVHSRIFLGENLFLFKLTVTMTVQDIFENKSNQSYRK